MPEGKAEFEKQVSGEWAKYGWTCASVGHKQFNQLVNCNRFPPDVFTHSRTPFLHYANLIRAGRPRAEIRQEIAAGYGNVSKKMFRTWRKVYQTAFGKGLASLDVVLVGRLDQTVACDKTIEGVNRAGGRSNDSRSINKHGARQPRTTRRRTKKLVRKRIVKQLPARTAHWTQQTRRTLFKLELKESFF
jgi:hypothetical protein